ncbi:MAG: hypothetical protein PHY11_02235 [Bacilli bacterium]|nr:hypothetical protein [Bacilli bacterium]MDD4065801.1 hypothetical protein [Bacilli bacterium]
MAKIEIKQVTTKKDLKKFIKFSDDLYKDEPNYVYYLHFDEMNFFLPEKNPAYEYCRTIEFLAYEDGKIVGRISGLINDVYNKKVNKKFLRFNHFDFIDDVEVARALMNAIIEWGEKEGMTELNGPLGATDLDKQGMLVEGFEYKGMYITYYNFAYYPKIMDQLGFKKDVDWVEYLVPMPKSVDPRLEKISGMLLDRYGFKLLNFKSFKEFEPYAKQLFHIMDEAFAPLHGTVPITEKQVQSYVDLALKVINFEYVKLIADKDGKIVAFGALASSLTEATRPSKGKLLPLGWYRVLHTMKHSKVLDMYFVGVLPEYQSLGVNAILMSAITKAAMKNGVEMAETGPELEDNEKIQAQWKNYEGVKKIRRRRCYIRKLEKL